MTADAREDDLSVAVRCWTAWPFHSPKGCISWEN